MSSNTKPDNDRPLRGRRLSWAEFRQLTGREPANDNKETKCKSSN